MPSNVIQGATLLVPEKPLLARDILKIENEVKPVQSTLINPESDDEEDAQRRRRKPRKHFGFIFRMKTFGGIKDKWSLVMISMSYMFSPDCLYGYPKAVDHHGGISFVLACLVVSIVIALPILFAQAVIGRYSKKGVLLDHINICPLLGGIGASMLVLSWILAIGNAMDSAVSMIYLFRSFNRTIPWTKTFKVEEDCWVRNPHDYLVNGILKTCSHSWTDYGAIDWNLFGYLAIGWILVCVICLLGTAVGWEFVKHLTYFQVCLVAIIFGFSFAPEGSLSGIFRLMTPDFGALKSVHTWAMALQWTAQSSSLFVGGPFYLGALYTGKRDLFHGYCLVVLAEFGLRCAALVITYGYFGHLVRKYNNLSWDDLDNYTGLVLISHAFSDLWVAQSCFALVFGLYLISNTLTLSMTVNICVHSLCKIHPKLYRKQNKMILLYCLLCLALALSICTPYGTKLTAAIKVSMYKGFTTGIYVLEIVMIGWFVGGRKILEFSDAMRLKIHPIGRLYLVMAWNVAAPLIILFFGGFTSFDIILERGVFVEFPYPILKICNLTLVLFLVLNVAMAYSACVDTGSFKSSLKSKATLKAIEFR